MALNVHSKAAKTFVREATGHYLVANNELNRLPRNKKTVKRRKAVERQRDRAGDILVDYLIAAFDSYEKRRKRK
jgi:hypothetical protein